MRLTLRLRSALRGVNVPQLVLRALVVGVYFEFLLAVANKGHLTHAPQLLVTAGGTETDLPTLTEVFFT